MLGYKWLCGHMFIFVLCCWQSSISDAQKYVYFVSLYILSSMVFVVSEK